MSRSDMTIDDIRNMLVKSMAAEAGLPPAEFATDVPFTAYGLDSMAALSVGMDIEDTCGLTDLPASLLWDHPTVDSLAEALWQLMNATPVAATTDGQ
ncbi:acyl carrier protein [Streptomyces sp. MAR4 CNX-425]|uniref:acyl carrier protein n=1 Tax=Streptomyces sp. MAR4 CNX-425 TaxID=3406343 RepID=UPI003B5059BF